MFIIKATCGSLFCPQTPHGIHASLTSLSHSTSALWLALHTTGTVTIGCETKQRNRKPKKKNLFNSRARKPLTLSHIWSCFPSLRVNEKLQATWGASSLKNPKGSPRKKMNVRRQQRPLKLRRRLTARFPLATTARSLRSSTAGTREKRWKHDI